MIHAPHIQKIIDEGCKAFNRWHVSQNNHDLGMYQAFRLSLLFLQMYGEETNRADAEAAFQELSTIGAEHPEEEVAAL